MTTIIIIIRIILPLFLFRREGRGVVIGIYSGWSALPLRPPSILYLVHPGRACHIIYIFIIAVILYVYILFTRIQHSIASLLLGIEIEDCR